MLKSGTAAISRISFRRLFPPLNEGQQHVRVVVNTALAKRMRQISQYLFFVTFAIPLLGFFILNSQPESIFVAVVLPVIVLVIALVVTVISVRLANLWVRVPRPEEVIPENLKGIGKQSVLYSYYHFPARHVLIAPQGVFALTVMYHDGRFSVDQDKWTRHQSGFARVASIFRFDSIGNPTAEARQAADHVQKLLADIAPDVEVQPIIVFTDPKVVVEVGETSVPVVAADSNQKKGSLKDYIWTTGRGRFKTLTPEQLEAFEAATVGT
ncbi:MAG: NERD domain-containing protein [Anaerolinea sp.]|nr:NERD domain-containing protein [Anaerolinea sp.]